MPFNPKNEVNEKQVWGDKYAIEGIYRVLWCDMIFILLVLFSISSPTLEDRKHTTRWIKIISHHEKMGDPIWITSERNLRFVEFQKKI
jgi:hypothetical protein